MNTMLTFTALVNITDNTANYPNRTITDLVVNQNATTKLVTFSIPAKYLKSAVVSSDSFYVDSGYWNY